jgi:GT2 family glycosyltransferase/ADP-heptose:LPS heptosyltransferase
MDKASTIGKYYRHFSRLTRETYQVQGVRGVLRGLARVVQRIIIRQAADYPRAHDYTPGLVSVAILTKNRLDLIQPCLEAIYAQAAGKYRFEVLLGDTGTTDPEVLEFYRQAKHKYHHLKITRFDHYNFSKNYNQLIKDQASGQYIVLLNNDTVVTAHWLENLVDPLLDTQIGIVGAKLLYPDDSIQHAGIEFTTPGNGFHIYAREPRDFPEANYPALVSAVTFAAAAFRHDVFDRFQLGENFQEEAQDTDFCFRLAAAGFKVLYNPAAEIYHREFSSRFQGKGDFDRLWFRRELAPRIDRLHLRRKWGPRIKELLAQDRQRRRFDPGHYRNAITIVRDDGIGDLLMGVSAFQKLRQRHPDKKLLLATYRRNIPMMAGFNIFDEFIPIPDDRKLSPLPLPQASQIFNFINLEMEFGPVWGITNEENKVNRHLVYTQKLGLDQDYALVPMPAYPAAREKVRQLLGDMGVDLSRKFVVLSLLTANPARSWWEPYYPALLDAVQAMGFTPIVVGIANTRCFNSPGVISLIGKTANITEYIEAVKLGRYVISTDTSAYHIAALAGIPFLAIFTGGVKPEARVNFYQRYEVVEPPAGLTCYPCWDEGCKDLSVRWRQDPCRLIVTPAEVIEKFKRLIERFPIN